MSNTAAGVLIDALRDWRVETLWSAPARSMASMEALRQPKDWVRFIQVPHGGSSNSRARIEPNENSKQPCSKDKAR